jgi:hypothetical protein
MAGAAITIGLQQLKGLLNITAFTTKMDLISVMKSVCRETHERGEWKEKPSSNATDSPALCSSSEQTSTASKW